MAPAGTPGMIPGHSIADEAAPMSVATTAIETQTDHGTEREPSAGDRPISEARLRANRRNAARSTGPRTAEGKERARMNGWIHGLRSAAENPGPEEREVVERVRPDWERHFPAGDECRAWLVEQMVLTAVRISKAQELQAEVARRDAERAVDAWALDREHEAAVLARRLPRDPAGTVAALKRTLAGARWLRGRWEGLAAALDGPETWGDEQRERLADLLGTASESRAADLASIADAPRSALRELIDDAIAELDGLLPALAAHDQAEQLLAISGRPIDPSRDLRRLRAAEARQQRLHAAARTAHALASRPPRDPRAAEAVASALGRAGYPPAAGPPPADRPKAPNPAPSPIDRTAPTVAPARSSGATAARPALNRRSLKEMRRQRRDAPARADRSSSK